MSILILVIPLGTAVPPALMVVAAVLGVVSIMTARIRHADRWREVVLWPVIAVMACWAISILCSTLPALAMRRAATMPLYSLILPTVQIAAWSRRSMTLVGGAALAAVSAMSLDAIYASGTNQALFTSGSGMTRGRIAGSQGNPNDFAAAMVLLPVGLLAMSERLGAWRWLILAILALPAWTLTISRQALVGWTVAIMGGLTVRTSSSRRRWIGIFSAILLIAIAALAIPAVRHRLSNTLQGDLGSRPLIHVYALSLLRDAPWTGIGPGVFGEYYVDGVTQDWQWRGQTLRPHGMPWIHSIPIEILVEWGVLGSLTTLAILAHAARSIRRGLLTTDERRNLAAAALTGGGVMLVIGLVDMTFLKDWFRCVFWLVLGLAFAGSSGLRDPGQRESQRET